MRQGPHQAAQKSTSTGTRAFWMISSNNCGSTSRGSPTGASGALQAPQRPVSARWSAGIRFWRPHVLQVRTMGTKTSGNQSALLKPDPYRAPGFLAFAFLPRGRPIALSFLVFCKRFLDCATRTASLALTRCLISRSSPVSGISSPDERRSLVPRADHGGGSFSVRWNPRAGSPRTGTRCAVRFRRSKPL
jgi:hypothetical protein